MKALIIRPGDRFGKLTIIKEISHKYGHRRFLCRCVCGNEIEVLLSSLRTGNTTECRNCGSTKHGLLKGVNSKEFRGSPLCSVYANMVNRCLNPKSKDFRNYGGRGIRICKEWLGNFPSFHSWSMLSGYSPGLTIDRINVNGNYCPSNCRWVTEKVQQNNKTSNHYISYAGITHTIAEWSEICHLPYECLKQRIYKGWDIGRALFEPEGSARRAS